MPNLWRYVTCLRPSRSCRSSQRTTATSHTILLGKALNRLLSAPKSCQWCLRRYSRGFGDHDRGFGLLSPMDEPLLIAASCEDTGSISDALLLRACFIFCRLVVRSEAGNGVSSLSGAQQRCALAIHHRRRSPPCLCESLFFCW